MQSFNRNQYFYLLFSVLILFFSIVLSPPSEENECVQLFGYNMPIICLHKTLNGYNCPGCGLTRSFVCFAHGQFKESFNFHRIGIVIYLFFAFQIVYRLYIIKFHSKGINKNIVYFNSYFSVVCIIALFLNWIYNIFSHQI